LEEAKRTIGKGDFGLRKITECKLTYFSIGEESIKCDFALCPKSFYRKGDN
jgi:hypothetical protein